MRLHELTASELSERLASGETSAAEVAEAHSARIDEVEERVDAFIELTRERALEQARQVDDWRAGGEKLGPLAGVPIAIKDVLCTRGVPTTCCSKILEGFRPPYDATTVRRCRNAGMPMLGKTNMDEFAMGSSTENSAFKITRNPWDLERVPGGSSGGSAAAVAAGEAPVALGSDTGGSIRQPAALCGITGLKPTYGRVSRYGLIAYASSLDQVGPLARDVRDCALVMNVLAGKDQRDATSAEIDVPDYVEALTGEVSDLRAGVPMELMGEGIDPQVRSTVEAAIGELEELGLAVEEVEMPNLDFSLPVYYLIAPAEAASNLARYDGVRYGHRTGEDVDDIYDLVAKSRGEGFGPEVRLRIMLGTFALSAGYYDAYYLKAQKVRTLIKRDFDAAFEDHDVLLSPTSPTVAFGIGEKADDPLQMKLADICTIPVNLAGIPALSIPCGMADGMPVGLQIMGRPFEEDVIMRVGDAYQQATGWHTKRPEL
ncbi:MAG: Asp-tRNA(Asn)/Glu-tRNA(Gln) amidotransferase subunit GatA [Armatimonadota bacterium]|nr:Asp-tRNA(Asn)/Glu-tRNA(Gln) amidotransferase subunit GatA [Armatimonadota bacterium]